MSIINSSIFLNRDEIPKNIRELLTTGCRVSKVGKFSFFNNPKAQKIWVDEKTESLKWKSKKNQKVTFSSIERLAKGLTSEKFARFRKKLNSKEELSLTIFYNVSDKPQTLDLVFENKDDLNLWFNALEAIREILEDKQKSMSPQQRHRLLLWKEADADNSNSLDKGEITQLLKYMNIQTTPQFVDELWKKLDVDGSEEIDQKEFEKFLNLLRNHPTIDKMYDAIVQGDISLIYNPDHKPRANIRSNSTTIENFTNFLRIIQHEEDATDEYAREVLDIPEEATIVDFEIFYIYITSLKNNELLSPLHATVFQDMTQPLTHYWIQSSHNTYLEGDQLNSASSVNRYVNDLLKGYRCVELDCWDGKDGEPIIYHGHTNTGKIPFKDVISAIKSNAFTNSDYPVILSIENHCSIEQQEKMAEIMIKMFGDMLAKPVDFSKRRQKTIPSPIELLGRFIIKTKVPPSGMEEVEDDYDIDPDNPEPEKETKPIENKKIKISPLFAQLAWMPGAKIKDVEEAIANHAQIQCSSFTEGKLSNFAKKVPAKFVELNQSCFSRIYPAGSRIDSSNYDPIQAFALGAQIVAINSQTAGSPLHLNEGLFRTNGRCGYVLKPKYLCEGSGFNPLSGPYPLENCKKYTLNIISAHSLPKSAQNIKSDIMDPYIVVEIFSGFAKDNQKFVSKHVNDNGFGPIFNFINTFTVQAPEIALIKFTIFDHNTVSGDAFIGVSVLPLSSVRTGIRTVAIYNKNFENKQSYQFAHLLVDLQIENAMISPTTNN